MTTEERNFSLISGFPQLKIMPHQRDIAKSAIANISAVLARAKTVNKPATCTCTLGRMSPVRAHLNKPNGAQI